MNDRQTVQIIGINPGNNPETILDLDNPYWLLPMAIDAMVCGTDIARCTQGQKISHLRKCASSGVMTDCELTIFALDRPACYIPQDDYLLVKEHIGDWLDAYKHNVKDDYWRELQQLLQLQPSYAWIAIAKNYDYQGWNRQFDMQIKQWIDAPMSTGISIQDIITSLTTCQ